MPTYNENDLETKIRESLESVVHVKATDESDGCGAKFEVVIVSSEFVGKPLLARHRKVHEILAVEMKDIHALTLKTITPDKWAGEATAAAESSADQACAP